MQAGTRRCQVINLLVFLPYGRAVHPFRNLPSRLLIAHGAHGMTDTTATHTLCLDSCNSAKNGRCEDGGQLIQPLEEKGPVRDRGPIIDIACDLGSDCTDCGPRVVVGPPAETPKTPVALLRSQNILVQAARTMTQPSFIMPFTDPKLDTDVSLLMANTRSVEPKLTWYTRSLTAQCCSAGGLFLDVSSPSAFTHS